MTFMHLSSVFVGGKLFRWSVFSKWQWTSMCNRQPEVESLHCFLFCSIAMKHPFHLSAPLTDPIFFLGLLRFFLSQVQAADVQQDLPVPRLVHWPGLGSGPCIYGVYPHGGCDQDHSFRWASHRGKQSFAFLSLWFPDVSYKCVSYPIFLQPLPYPSASRRWPLLSGVLAAPGLPTTSSRAASWVSLWTLRRTVAW